MPAVVLDPGVLVSAALAPRGVCGRLLVAASHDMYRIVLCPTLVAELNEVLLGPRFRSYLTAEQAQRFVVGVAAVGEMRSDPAVRHGVTPAPDDDYLMVLALEHKADYLISGDNHLREIVGSPINVLSPRSFLTLIDPASAT